MSTMAMSEFVTLDGVTRAFGSGVVEHTCRRASN